MSDWRTRSRSTTSSMYPRFAQDAMRFVLVRTEFTCCRLGWDLVRERLSSKNASILSAQFRLSPETCPGIVPSASRSLRKRANKRAPGCMGFPCSSRSDRVIQLASFANYFEPVADMTMRNPNVQPKAVLYERCIIVLFGQTFGEV